jgi:hypothetical protein
MFAVLGTYLDRPYVAIWAKDTDGTGSVKIPNHVGVEALLDARQGESFPATPTGPTFALHQGDAASVLCALLNLTTVTGITGDAPDLGAGGECDPDAVF